MALFTDAELTLKRNRLGVSRIVHVDVDSVLYISEAGLPMTAWLYRNPTTGVVRVEAERGFAATPSSY